MDFFTAEVVPELSNPQANPLLKADAIKFVSTFRNQMPVDAMEQLFPLLLNCLEPSQFVVHTYAAACLERLLTVKDDGVLRFSSARLAPYLSKLLDHLFNILEAPNYPENDYLMRLVMRLINVSKQDILPLANVVVDRLTRILNRICANPSNPTFSHYLFEALSALILNVCSANPSATETFEALLFPPFQKVLTNDVEALSPYVYQVLAQMLELRPSGVSPAYMSLFPVLLNPTIWERVSNAPAIVKLLEVRIQACESESIFLSGSHCFGCCPQAYMRKAPQDVSKSATGILGVFQKLIVSRTTEVNAFSLLRGFIVFMPPATYQTYLNEIVKILMIRLQSRMAGRSPTAFAVELIYTMSVMIGKLGPDVFTGALETLQAGYVLGSFSFLEH
jgi:exportin-2 (importin alpha re-exporter)